MSTRGRCCPIYSFKFEYMLHLQYIPKMFFKKGNIWTYSVATIISFLTCRTTKTCLYSTDKTDTDEHMESGKHLTFRTSLIDKEIKENSEWQREHTENQHFEEMKKEERVRQRENDFQEELNKLMEAEKVRKC